MKENPDVSIVVVSYNTCQLLRRCLLCLQEAGKELAYEAIVVDNASHDDSCVMVAEEFPEAVVIRNSENIGFAAANNIGFRRAQGRYVVILNSDALLDKDALCIAVKKMDNDPSIGMGGGRLMGANGEWQPSARLFPSVFNELLTLSGLACKYPRSRIFGRTDRRWAPPSLSAEVDWVPGAFAIIRRSTLERVGYFDERFFFYFEEVDLCRRIKQSGDSIMYWGDVKVVHLGGESAKTIEGTAFCEKGSQLMLWRMYSQCLYYYKHSGYLRGLIAYQVESLWYWLYILKQKSVRDQASRDKEKQARHILQVRRQAWRDTKAGSICPPKPWTTALRSHNQS